MKKLTILIALFLTTSLISQGQNVTRDAAGNFIAIKHDGGDKGTAKKTGKTFTDNSGNKYPVYESAKGKLFVIRKSGKTGAEYKMYLKY